MLSNKDGLPCGITGHPNITHMNPLFLNASPGSESGSDPSTSHKHLKTNKHSEHVFWENNNVLLWNESEGGGPFSGAHLGPILKMFGTRLGPILFGACLGSFFICLGPMRLPFGVHLYLGPYSGPRCYTLLGGYCILSHGPI